MSSKESVAVSGSRGLPAPKKWVIICCPVSGKKVGQSLMENVFIPRMKELNKTRTSAPIEVEMVLTTHAGHATDLAKKYGSAECGLVVVGGDGTLHEVLDGLIAVNKLSIVQLAILSQGTMNAYFHSGCLPTVDKLPDYIFKNSYRTQSLMRMRDDSGKINTMCFEAVYLGVGYKPAKGAQEYRKSFLGPFFGIMFNLVKCCMFPQLATISGQLVLTPKADKGPNVKDIKIEDDFYWIVISQRSPYNGALTEDEMWVNYITKKNFPGFGRMFGAFAPPMEFFSGLTNLMENHICVSKVEFIQDAKKSGNIGICLDGDPMEGGQKLVAEHIGRAWNIVADKEFPKKISQEMTVIREPTECAKRWLAANPVPKGVYKPELMVKPSSGVGKLMLLAVSGLVAAASVYLYMHRQEVESYLDTWKF